MARISGSEVSAAQLLRLREFVRTCTGHFDSSHNHEHAEEVYQETLAIAIEEAQPYEEDVLTYSAQLHDVRDKKYPQSISERELITFLQQELGDQSHLAKSYRVLRIIENVSYSTELKEQRVSFGKYGAQQGLMEHQLNCVSDADRITALGNRGITRTRILIESWIENGRISATELTKAGSIEALIIRHCYEKLLKLYPAGFIRTNAGRRRAAPLHRELEDYVAAHSPMPPS